MNTDNNENNGNKGNRGRFSDRLKKMRRDRVLKRKNANALELDDENTLKRGSRNILKIILALPSVIYNNVKVGNETKKNDLVRDKELVDEVGRVQGSSIEITSNNLVNKNVDYVKSKEEKRIKVDKIREIDASLLKKKRELYLNTSSNSVLDETKFQYPKSLDSKISGTNNIVKEKDIGINKLSNSNTYKVNGIVDTNKDIRIVKLQKEIIDLIKKKLVKNINELEILQSELYILKELKVDNLYLKDCQEDIKEIKKLLSKIKSLKEKYDYLKENVDFEYMLEYEDDLLIDKILELKELCSNDDIRHTVNDYKILDEYKFLYLKIDKLEEDTIKYEEHKNQKVEELKKRDIDFDKLKDKVYDVDREKEKYERFVREQELFLKSLEDKIAHVDSYEKVSYRLKGFNQLLGNSFKYLGLLLVNPLKGLVPGIATQTLITKNIIHNLYNNLEWEENRKMVYQTIDYSDSINMAINNLDDTSTLVDVTLKEIIELKNKYMRDFKKYEYSLSSYRDTIKKINKMENAVLSSKIKIDLMKQRMREKENQNSDKMKRVKKLNSSE